MLRVLAKSYVLQLPNLLAHGLIDIWAGEMTNFNLSHNLNTLVLIFFDSPETKLDLASASRGLVRSVLSSRNRLVYKINHTLYLKLASHVDIVDLISIPIDVDLMIKFCLLLGNIAY